MLICAWLVLLVVAAQGSGRATRVWSDAVTRIEFRLGARGRGQSCWLRYAPGATTGTGTVALPGPGPFHPRLSKVALTRLLRTQAAISIGTLWI